MSDKVKIILGVVLGIVGAMLVFCLIVCIACSVNGLTFGEQKIFNGWKVGDEFIDLDTYTILANTKIVADITYKYDVKFVVDGVTVNSQIVTKNNKAILPENPTNLYKLNLKTST